MVVSCVFMSETLGQATFFLNLRKDNKLAVQILVAFISYLFLFRSFPQHCFYCVTFDQQGWQGAAHTWLIKGPFL